MTRYSKLRIAAAFSLVTLAFVGCTNEEDLGGRAAEDGGASNGNSDGPDGSTPSTNADGGKDSGGSNLFGTTKAGESCDPADYPPAPASCTIEGRYTVTESWCQDGACGAAPPSTDNYQWVAEVTVDGTEVRLTNGVDRLLKCQLDSACDCRRSGGSLIRFLADGFVATGEADCPGTPGGTLYSRDVGVRQ
ncbi:MAG: hypothetical protein KF850_41265 [Labilithrix sp.]|nr:hypothetical protein [Labilithrix sp.]